MLKRLFNFIQFIITARGDIVAAAVNNNLVDLSGQGRNKYGH